MPKPLRQPPPSSSVARLLDLGAAARAVATVQPDPAPPQQTATVPATPPAQSAQPVITHAPAANTAPPPAPQPPAATGEQPNVKREFVLTPSADATFSRIVDLYRRSTGTRLTSSHVARAMLMGVAHCMDSLEREARRITPTKLPSNARGRELERERFEARLADAFVAGMRAAAAFDRTDR
jgi:hypothetical protein